MYCTSETLTQDHFSQTEHDTDLDMSMRDEQIGSRSVFCQFVEQDLTLSWKEIVDYDGMEPGPMRVTKHRCLAVGKGNCPVGGVPGNRNWKECPYFP